jgi:acyl dehydratase
MMQAKHSLQFARSPAVWTRYPGILVSRKPGLVPVGGEVPRIEGRIARVTVDRAHLASYAKLCGASSDATLPIAYPHVLAMPLHLAMLGAEAFPVKLLGLVHTHHRIALRRPLPIDEAAEIRAWIAGHRDTERGQEFQLHTEYLIAGETVWDESCIFLARHPPGAAGTRNAPSDDGTVDAPLRTSSFVAPRGLGRRYGFISRDLNPIHLSDVSARAFGFPKAIAHGMWALARVAAEMEGEQPASGCELTVAFRSPIYLPSSLALQRWPVADGTAFVLRDGRGEKPNLTGTLTSLR